MTARAVFRSPGDHVRPVTHVALLDSIRENKLSLVERLADDLAHEIKNPLHSMVINLEVLRRRLARLETNNNEELLRYAGVLGSELERVNRRVDLLLRIARPNPVSEDLGSLVEIVEELREILEIECDRRQVHLSIDLPITALRARTSRAQARQIILTLALQIIDSLPRGSTLSVTSEAGTEFVRVHIHGLDTTGAAVTREPTDPAALAKSSSLAEQIGGRLDMVGGPAAIGNGSSATSQGFIVSIPLKGR
jgi:signal transduction histidine kinase